MTPFEQNWFWQSNLVASDPETVRNLSRYQSGDKKNGRKRNRAEKTLQIDMASYGSYGDCGSSKMIKVLRSNCMIGEMASCGSCGYCGSLK